MKKFTLAGAAAAAALALAALAHGAAAPATMSHQYRCTDRNQSLAFVAYENDGKLTGIGHMYVEGMQTAVLNVTQDGTDVLKAAVAGNTPNVAYQLRKSGSVLVANYGTPGSRAEVCKASYKYQ